MHYWVKIGDLSVQIEDFISNRISILSSISMSARTRTSSAVCVDKRQDSYLFASEYINSFLLAIIRIKLWAMRPDKRLQTVEDRNTSLLRCGVCLALDRLQSLRFGSTSRTDMLCFVTMWCDMIWLLRLICISCPSGNIFNCQKFLHHDGNNCNWLQVLKRTDGIW